MGEKNEEILPKVNRFMVRFFWIYTNEKNNVLLSRSSIPKQIKTLSTSLKEMPSLSVRAWEEKGPWRII